MTHDQQAHAALERLVTRAPYRAWAALPGNARDAAKVTAELAGDRRPWASGGLFRDLQELARFHPPPAAPTTTGLAGLHADLARGGAIFTNPTSPPVEHCRALAIAGYRHVAFNIGDHPIEAWDKWLTEASRNGLTRHVWMHCQTTPGSSATAKLGKLLDVAETERMRPLVNIEGPQVRGDLHPDLVADVLAIRQVTNAAVITDGWIVAPAGSKDWARLSRRAVIVANWLPQDAPETIGRDKGAHLVAHSASLDIPWLLLSCGAQRYRDGHRATPADYAPHVPWVYAGDNVAPTVEAWRAWKELA